ncbi:Caspase-8 [Habropoda laboriosa]|uniref:Caspase-8 n=1 Tax=Habropoda laboriosa TaxID=597456 RepID=A0A0L7RG46_9HYME|nr:PREDICTED: caspase-8-like [Habropoda laboriosa]KOC69706.1 Caspase-8 [Habropoda laboriosa]
MFLSVDALPYPFLNINISENKLNRDILRKIEDDLDIDEKISILFLMINDYRHSFKEIYDLLQKHKEHKAYILIEFIDHYPDNWKNKLLEAICVIQNRQIIRKLGISFQDLNLLYLAKNRSCSRYINVVAKCLYLLCEALSEDRIKLLLQYVKSDLTEYLKYLEDIDFLELHMLYWMQENYISIQTGGNLKNLLKHIKRFDDLELIYEDLKNHENHQNMLDIQHVHSANTVWLQTFSMREGVQVLSNIEKDIKKLNKGLCVIINQMYFVNKKFETRFGTSADCKKLLETFQGFGFTVEVLSNLKKDEILQKLEDIPKEFGTDYDCIFLCILSHGTKGCIISSDEEEVSIETIECKFCCAELENVIKIVVIQACQGETTGEANDTLDTDGPVNNNVRNILAYKNFCIFMSTIQGFVSVRHKEEGSWFIQDFCNILQTGGNNITFLGAVNETIQSVVKKRGRLNQTDSIAQLPELRSYRLLSDFQLPEYQASK